MLHVFGQVILTSLMLQLFFTLLDLHFTQSPSNSNLPTESTHLQRLWGIRSMHLAGQCFRISLLNFLFLLLLHARFVDRSSQRSCFLWFLSPGNFAAKGESWHQGSGGWGLPNTATPDTARRANGSRRNILATITKTMRFDPIKSEIYEIETVEKITILTVLHGSSISRFRIYTIRAVFE